MPTTFETRTMTQALRQLPPVKTFLLDTFFKRSETHDTRTIEIDIVRGKRRLAPYVRPIDEGHLVDRVGFTAQSLKLPYIKIKRATEAGQLMQRRAGETVYANSSPQQRGRAILARDMSELREMIIRREEYSAADALLNGQTRITGDGIDAVVDYLRSADHRIVLTSTANAWDATGADILKDLRDWKRKIAEDSGLSANVAVFGSGVVDTFIKSPEIKALLDNRRMELGSIQMRHEMDGVSFIGTILGVDIYEYDEWAINPATGLEEPLIPSGTVLLGATRARSVRHYGAIEDLQAKNWAVDYFAKSWVEEDPSLRFLMVQSAPLPATHQTDAFIHATVL